MRKNPIRLSLHLYLASIPSTISQTQRHAEKIERARLESSPRLGRSRRPLAAFFSFFERRQGIPPHGVRWGWGNTPPGRRINAWAAPPFLRSDSHGALHWREKAARWLAPRLSFGLLGSTEAERLYQEWNGFTAADVAKLRHEAILWVCQ